MFAELFYFCSGKIFYNFMDSFTSNDIPYFIICGIVLTIIPYLLGSINFAIIISKLFYHDDVRSYGSGNAGMTNMLRTYGKGSALITLLGDALKAIVATLIGYFMMGMMGAYIAGFFSMLGHNFPIFFKFKGGKGVVTAGATMLMCNPIVFFIVVGLFFLIVGIYRYISLGSVMCALLYPVVLSFVDQILLKHDSGLYIIFAILTTVLIVVRHKDNIKRLLAGNENKVSLKSKKKQ